VTWVGRNSGYSLGASRIAAWLSHRGYHWYDEHCDRFCYHTRTLSFDFAVWVSGYLFIIEYSETSLHGANGTLSDQEKAWFMGRSNVPLLVLTDNHVFGGDFRESICEFLATRVEGRQEVNPTRGTWSKMLNRLPFNSTETTHDVPGHSTFGRLLRQARIRE